VPLQAIRAAEPIPGYRVRERIGAGGYGEVWAVDAPGGLVKAIKFVYGYLDEDRATRELKALNRIKAVRHPFLLSLERIEVVDGQLLIVTELAEGSLKDRFDKYRKEGATGIPRDELIRYMHDAADVLDFMNVEHSLQHLDVKPENLLLLAGRVKVADFGLVKDIHDVTVSLMGGLTPLYAPPEVFDGRPSRWSDQYSLAIVYQEMLTSELPFPGTTAAQLARQHLNARPRLAALSENDQAVIGRSLSKKPADRYGSCKEMVDALDREDALTSSPPAPAAAPRRAHGGAARHPDAQKNVDPSVRQSDARPWPGKSAVDLVARVASAPQLTVLPPIEVPDAPIQVLPTLYLGAGRSASRILWRLRRRLEDRFGALERIPSFQMLLLDTDWEDLWEVSDTYVRGGFKPHEVVHVPLRRPQDYRDESEELLTWMSRRWLYNIPRSLRTDGLRPLGRLAMVDRGSEIVGRIRRAMDAAAANSAVEASQVAAGLPFVRQAMRVVLVSSISGGTGSGMVLDLGYLARHLLAESGFSDDHVCAFLTHSTGRHPHQQEFSIVNAYCTLTELNHFSAPGGWYPGENGLELPPRDAGDNRPFGDTYLVHLGDGLNAPQFDESADRVAEYLYLDAITKAGSFFRACRTGATSNPRASGTDVRLRTFGVLQLSYLHEDVADVAVEHVCRQLVDRWLTGVKVAGDPLVLTRKTTTVGCRQTAARDRAFDWLLPSAEQFFSSLNASGDAVVSEVCQHIESVLGWPLHKYFDARLTEMAARNVAESHDVPCGLVAEFKEEVDRLCGPRSVSDEGNRNEPGVIQQAAAAFGRGAAKQRGDEICRWIQDKVEDPDARIRGAHWLARWFRARCDSHYNAVAQLRERIDADLLAVESGLDATNGGKGRGKASQDRRALLERYGRLRLERCAVDAAAALLKAASSHVVAAEEELIDLARDMQHFAGQFDTSRTLDELPCEADAKARGKLLGDALETHVAPLLQCLEEQLHADVLVPAKGLRNLILQAGPSRANLATTLRTAVRTAIVGLAKQLDVADQLFRKGPSGESDVETMRKQLEAAKPLLQCGGARRLLVIMPRCSTHTRPIEILHYELKETPSVVENCDGDFVLCQEVEDVSLTQVAVTLIEGRRDFADYAARLHTRVDVNWSILPDFA